MTLLHAIILGIVEGVTEFLPISSTGHLIIVSHFLKIADSDFTKSFEIIIQLGAVLAVIVLYAKTLWNQTSMLLKLLVAFIPTGLIGLVVYSYIKTYLLGNLSVVVLALALGGVILIAFEYWMQKDGEGTLETISYKQAFVIGLFQTLAFIPGVSRAAATIVTGRTLGLSRKAAIEFSFLLSIPTMLAASGLDLVKNASLFSAKNFGLLAVGFVVSAVVAGFSIVTLLRFIRAHTFIPFGVYRIVAAVIFFYIFFI
jgi:undecaprenyl-diphosphatase